MLTKEKIQSFTKELSTPLVKVPEVQNSCLWMKENPGSFIAIIEDYLRLMKIIDDINEMDLRVIKKVEDLLEQRGVGKTNSSTITTSNFIRTTKDNISLYEVASEAFDMTSVHFQDALAQLSEMMYNGHKMFASGGIPKDGDALSGTVIWGHTQMKDTVLPSTVAHFIISHFLTRFFSLALHEFNILEDKDDFLVPMTSALLLSQAKNPDDLSIIVPWITQKTSSGLGWVTEDQLEVYKEALAIVEKQK